MIKYFSEANIDSDFTYTQASKRPGPQGLEALHIGLVVRNISRRNYNNSHVTPVVKALYDRGPAPIYR